MPTFKQAFAAARKSGKKEFTWNGKRYNTKLKEDSSLPVPKDRPKNNSPKKPKQNFVAASTDRKSKARKPVAPRVGIARPNSRMAKAAQKAKMKKK